MYMVFFFTIFQFHNHNSAGVALIQNMLVSGARNCVLGEPTKCPMSWHDQLTNSLQEVPLSKFLITKKSHQQILCHIFLNGCERLFHNFQGFLFYNVKWTDVKFYMK